MKKEIYFCWCQYESHDYDIFLWHHHLTDEMRRKRAKLGDRNYNSGHSIDVNGNCNMGCC